MTTCAYIVVYANGSKVPRPRLVYVIVYGGAWRWRRCGGVGGGAGWVGGWAGWWSGGRGVGKWAGVGGGESCYLVRKLLGITDLYGVAPVLEKGSGICVSQCMLELLLANHVCMFYTSPTHTAIITFAYSERVHTFGVVLCSLISHTSRTNE